MTTLNGNNGKRIQFALSNIIHECENNVYIAEMPFVVCNNRKDAELIQEQIGTFVSELSEVILDNK